MEPLQDKPQERRRTLPAWMVSQPEKKNHYSHKRGLLKSAGPPKKQNKRSIVYCMNEEELVNTALSILGKRQLNELERQNSEDVNLGRKSSACEVNSPFCDSESQTSIILKDAHDEASKTNSPLKSFQKLDQPDGAQKMDMSQEILAAQSSSHSPPCKFNTERSRSVSAYPVEEVEEEDAFKLVREIFFTPRDKTIVYKS
ncbi:cell cycle regulator of non-homologous end joining-like [Polypterus senegalus]|uniref:cell cycle regulator of non-homologous end joining-like n=1 Tax=Polypterus senegalus TaxID=55291 RepID=UPI0019634080|nr:cell cycle regulator of non-homologous end joining-like [Polypterus senegalus]